MNNHIAGGVAGLAATAPMTLAMELMHQQLPWQERYPLPPREITEKLAEEAEIEDEMSEEEQLVATLASHFGYGTACGVVYSTVADKLSGPPALRGIQFGLVVWAGSYLGLLPAMGILKPATEHPMRRNALMIAAHVVWGAATGAITDSIADKPIRKPQ